MTFIYKNVGKYKSELELTHTGMHAETRNPSSTDSIVLTPYTDYKRGEGKRGTM